MIKLLPIIQYKKFIKRPVENKGNVVILLILLVLSIFIFIFVIYLRNRQSPSRLGVSTAALVKTGFPVNLAPSVNYGFYNPSSVVLADVDNDNKKEIIVYGRKGIDSFNSKMQVSIIEGDGSNHPGWPKEVSNPKPTTGTAAYVGNFGAEATTPVADINKDGVSEIIVIGYDYNKDSDKLVGIIHAYRADGSEAAGWPLRLNGMGLYNPVIGKVSGSSEDNVVVSGRNPVTREKFVYVINSNGQVLSGFPFSLGFDEDKIGHKYYPLISLSDLNSDSYKEILTYSGSQLYAIDGNAKVMTGWPVKLSNVYVFAKIVSGDVNNDGKPEIFLTSAVSKAFLVHGYNSKGTKLSGWEKRLGSSGGAGPQGLILSDIDNDGSPEVLLGFLNSTKLVYAWNGDGSNVSGWPVTFGQNNSTFTELIALDKDGNGKQTIVVPGWGTDPGIYAVSYSGNIVTDWPYYPTGTSYLPWYSTPAVGDIDNNGLLDFVATQSDGRLYAWELGAKITNRIEWSMFGNGPTLDGCYIK